RCRRAAYFFDACQQRGTDGIIGKPDVVSSEADPGKLACQVVFLIGRSCRTENSDRLTSSHQLLQSHGNIVKSLIPQNRLLFSVALQQWLLQSVAPQGRLMRAPTSCAKLAPGHWMSLARCDTRHLSIPRQEVESAATGTEWTSSWDGQHDKSSRLPDSVTSC